MSVRFFLSFRFPLPEIWEVTTRLMRRMAPVQARGGRRPTRNGASPLKGGDSLSLLSLARIEWPWNGHPTTPVQYTTPCTGRVAHWRPFFFETPTKSTMTNSASTVNGQNVDAKKGPFICTYIMPQKVPFGNPASMLHCTIPLFCVVVVQKGTVLQRKKSSPPHTSALANVRFVLSFFLSLFFSFLWNVLRTLTPASHMSSRNLLAGEKRGRRGRERRKRAPGRNKS